MYGRILVGTDGSDESLAALDYASELAERTDAILHVVTVAPEAGGSMTFGIEDVSKIDDAGQQLLEDVIDRNAGRELDIETVVLRGNPGLVLLDYAEEIDADLIVVGRTGVSGGIGGLLGGTAGFLIRNAERPVTIVSG